jgi:hypothetical protein
MSGWALPRWLTGRLVFGIFIVLVGVVFILDEFGLADAGQVLRNWPLVLVVAGLLKLVQPGGAPGRVVGAVLVVAGAGLLLDVHDRIDFDWDVVFPILLVLVGAFIVRRALAGPPSAAPDAGGADTVHGFAVLGGLTRRSASRAFRGGDASAVLGACEIDLTQAELAPGGAVLDTFAFWGGIEVRVPPDWQVEVRGTPLLGAFEDSTRTTGGGDKRLVVTGLAIMGGVEVKTRARHAQDEP